MIGKILPATGAITEYPVPTSGSGPVGITTGPDGNLWFTESQGNKIGKIIPATGAITEYPVTTSGSDPFGITTGSDGNLWFTEAQGNKIGKLDPGDRCYHRIPRFYYWQQSETVLLRVLMVTCGSPRLRGIISAR